MKRVPTWYASFVIEGSYVEAAVVLDAALDVLDWLHHSGSCEHWHAPALPVAGEPMRLSCRAGAPFQPGLFGKSGRLATDMAVDFGKVLRVERVTASMRRRLKGEGPGMALQLFSEFTPRTPPTFPFEAHLMDFG